MTSNDRNKYEFEWAKAIAQGKAKFDLGWPLVDWESRLRWQILIICPCSSLSCKAIELNRQKPIKIGLFWPKIEILTDNLDDWSDLKQQIKSGLNIDRGPIIHTAIQQKRFEIAENLIKHG